MHREVGAGQRKPAFAYWSVLGEWGVIFSPGVLE